MCKNSPEPQLDKIIRDKYLHPSMTWVLDSVGISAMLINMRSHSDVCPFFSISPCVKQSLYDAQKFGFQCKCGRTWLMYESANISRYEFGKLMGLQGRFLVSDALNSGRSVEEIQDLELVYDSMTS